MATRHQVRESIISLLYAYEVGNQEIDKFLEEILEDKKIRNKQKEFAIELFNGIIKNLKDIDDIIKDNIDKWDFDRIGIIEKAILRLGSYEILYSNLDKPVVINEAIEITKKFGGDNSPKFINGVLDKLNKIEEES